MSASVGRRILSQFCGSRLSKLSARAAIVRFNCTKAKEKVTSSEGLSKGSIPAPEPGKICAAVLRKLSEPLVIENLEPPKHLQANEVLIDVSYCAFNASDALLYKNMYNFEPNLPMVLGSEVVGKLIQVGEEAEKNGFKVGDKVVALNKDRYGGLAEQCVAEIEDIWKVPSAIKSIDAVSLLDNYITALVGLERTVSVQEDDILLINVGVSGIGLAAVDLATNVFLAQVISICASEDGAALAREKGVFASLKFKSRKLLKQIEQLAAEKNIKAIFEDTNGEYFKKVLSCFTDVYKDGATLRDLLRDDNFAVVVHHLSREGRVIVAGSAKNLADPSSDVQDGSFTVTGLDMREYRKKKPEVYRQAGEDILQFFEEGLITPTCSLVVGLHKVNDAVQFVLDKKSAGKVIVDIKNKEEEAKDTTK